MDKIEQFKELTKLGGCSEYVLGIEYPAEHQCSHIDGIIREIEIAQDSVGEADYAIIWENYGTASGHIDNINKCLDGRINDLEEIRQSFMQLRQWGEDWKMIAKYLLDKSDIEVIDIINYIKENKEEE